jgi:hypothetical protein
MRLSYYFTFAFIPPALIYDGDKIDMLGLLPALPSYMDELSAEEQAECRLQLRLANRHKLHMAKSWLRPR